MREKVTPDHLQLHAIDSPRGRLILSRQKLTPETLARAIEVYQAAENVKVERLTGVHNRHGVFYVGGGGEWLGFIPWVQVQELLGHVPDGTSGDFFNTGGGNH